MGKTSLLRLTAHAMVHRDSGGGGRRAAESARVWWIDARMLLRSFSVLGFLPAVGTSAKRKNALAPCANDKGGARQGSNWLEIDGGSAGVVIL